MLFSLLLILCIHKIHAQTTGSSYYPYYSYDPATTNGDYGSSSSNPGYGSYGSYGSYSGNYDGLYYGAYGGAGGDFFQGFYGDWGVPDDYGFDYSFGGTSPYGGDYDPGALFGSPYYGSDQYSGFNPYYGYLYSTVDRDAFSGYYDYYGSGMSSVDFDEYYEFNADAAAKGNIRYGQRVADEGLSDGVVTAGIVVFWTAVGCCLSLMVLGCYRRSQDKADFGLSAVCILNYHRMFAIWVMFGLLSSLYVLFMFNDRVYAEATAEARAAYEDVNLKGSQGFLPYGAASANALALTLDIDVEEVIENFGYGPYYLSVSRYGLDHYDFAFSASISLLVDFLSFLFLSTIIASPIAVLCSCIPGRQLMRRVRSVVDVVLFMASIAVLAVAIFMSDRGVTERQVCVRVQNPFYVFWDIRGHSPFKGLDEEPEPSLTGIFAGEGTNQPSFLLSETEEVDQAEKEPGGLVCIDEASLADMRERGLITSAPRRDPLNRKKWRAVRCPDGETDGFSVDLACAEDEYVNFNYETTVCEEPGLGGRMRPTDATNPVMKERFQRSPICQRQELPNAKGFTNAGATVECTLGTADEPKPVRPIGYLWKGYPPCEDTYSLAEAPSSVASTAERWLRNDECYDVAKQGPDTVPGVNGGIVVKYNCTGFLRLSSGRDTARLRNAINSDILVALIADIPFTIMNMLCLFIVLVVRPRIMRKQGELPDGFVEGRTLFGNEWQCPSCTRSLFCGDIACMWPVFPMYTLCSLIGFFGVAAMFASESFGVDTGAEVIELCGALAGVAMCCGCCVWFTNCCCGTETLYEQSITCRTYKVGPLADEFAAQAKTLTHVVGRHQFPFEKQVVPQWAVTVLDKDNDGKLDGKDEEVDLFQALRDKAKADGKTIDEVLNEVDQSGKLRILARFTFLPESPPDNPLNAIWISRAVDTSYMQPEEAEKELREGMGFGGTHYKFFSRTKTCGVPCWLTPLCCLPRCLTCCCVNEADTQAYVAVREDVAIVGFRGTEAGSLTDWSSDFSVARTTSYWKDAPSAKMHRGFKFALELIADELVAYLEEAGVVKLDGTNSPKETTVPIWVTGHSLGGALAIAFTAYLDGVHGIKVRYTATFGQPRVGNAAFKEQYDKRGLGERTVRFVLCTDVIAQQPPNFLGYSHVGSRVYYSSTGDIMPHAEAGDGDELKFAVFEDKLSGLARFDGEMAAIRGNVGYYLEYSMGALRIGPPQLDFNPASGFTNHMAGNYIQLAIHNFYGVLREMPDDAPVPKDMSVLPRYLDQGSGGSVTFAKDRLSRVIKQAVVEQVGEGLADETTEKAEDEEAAAAAKVDRRAGDIEMTELAPPENDGEPKKSPSRRKKKKKEDKVDEGKPDAEVKEEDGGGAAATPSADADVEAGEGEETKADE